MPKSSISLIRKALRRVVDPELGVNIVDLGLVRAISFIPAGVEIKMILTSPTCPYGETIIEDVKKFVAKLPGIDKVKVQIQPDLPWTADLASEAVRIELGLD